MVKPSGRCFQTAEVNKTEKAQSRESRSCGGKGSRQKRSCIGVKDPPTTPPPSPRIIIPEYNSSTDVNYTMSVTVTSCLYWSEKKQVWTNEGCSVGWVNVILFFPEKQFWLDCPGLGCLKIVPFAVISGFTCKRGERVNSALYWYSLCITSALWSRQEIKEAQIITSVSGYVVRHSCIPQNLSIFNS